MTSDPRKHGTIGVVALFFTLIGLASLLGLLLGIVRTVFVFVTGQLG